MPFYNPDQPPMDFGYGPTDTGKSSQRMSSEPTDPKKKKKGGTQEPNTMRGTEGGAYDGIDVSDFANV